MKHKVFLKIVLLFTFISSYSQTVTVAINDKVLASKDTAIVDINADGIIDIKILRFTGIDNIIYSATSKQANIKIGDLPKTSGQPFSNYGNQCSLPSSVFGCFWIPAWQLNTVQKYMGYYRLNAPGDTTFGYINLNFLGDNQSGCFDTLYVYSNTYSSVPNIHLLAGQSTSTVCQTPITYSIQVTQPTCSGCCDGSAQIVNLSGGCSTPYSITWIPSGGTNMAVNNLCSGNYSVNVMDSQGGSCCPSVTQGFVLSSPCTTPITYSIQVTPPTCSVCCDGIAQVVNLTGGCSAPYSGQWSDGSWGLIKNNLCSGNYSVNVMDSQVGSCCPSVTQGCYVPTTPCITFSVQTTPETCVGCCDGTAEVVNLQGGCAPYSFQWNDPSSQLTNIATGLCSGSYSVLIQDPGCCPSIVQGCFVPSGGTTSVNESNLGNGLSIFPNPTHSILNIIDKQNQFQYSTIEVRNYLGQIILSKLFANQLDLSSLPSGMYYLHLYDKGRSMTIKKVIKK